MRISLSNKRESAMYQHDLPHPDDSEDPPSGLVLILGVICALAASGVLWFAIIVVVRAVMS